MEADIEVLDDEKRRASWVETLPDLLGKTPAAGSVVPIVQHGSGSILAIWVHPAGRPLEQCPVVWIDSEGSPCEVLAANVAELLTLVPYSLGALYDCLRYAERAVDDPSKKPPKKTCDDPDAWVSAGITPHPNPAAAVLAAYRAHSRFSASI